MSSQKITTPKLKLPLPLQPTPISYIFCPSNTFSNRIPADPRVTLTDRPDMTSTIITGRHLKELSDQVESAVERTMTSELNGSGLSLLNMLEGRNLRQEEGMCLMEYLRDSEEESRLREEVDQLKKDLIMKSSFIEKLISENQSLRKEMDEVLGAVEDAKGKINMKLNGCNQRIQELENEIKSLTEENKNYQEQLTRINIGKEINNKQGLRKHDDNIFPSLSEPLNGFTSSSKILLQSCSNLLQSQFTTDTVKEGVGKVRSRHGSPNQVRPNLSISKPKPGQLGRTLRHPTAANNSPVAQERSGAVNNCNRRNKMLTLHHIQDTVFVNKSENNCAGGMSAGDIGMMRRTPKAAFTPKMKVKMIGYEFDDA